MRNQACYCNQTTQYNFGSLIFITQLNYLCVQKLIILEWKDVMEKYWSQQELNPGLKGHEPDTTTTTLASIEVIVFR